MITLRNIGKSTAVLLLGVSFMSKADFKAEVYSGVDFDRKLSENSVKTVDLDQLNIEYDSSLSVRFSGAFRPETSGNHRFTVKGTQVWRLFVNGKMVIDYTHVRNYEKAMIEQEYWNRLSEAVVSLKAGLECPIVLEYTYEKNEYAVPANVQLLCSTGIAPSKDVVSVSEKLPKPLPIPRSAADFHRSIGVVINKIHRLDSDEFGKLKERIGDLSPGTVRGTFFPTVAEDDILHKRYREIYEEFGIPVCGNARESFSTDDPEETMTQIAAEVRKASDYLFLLEGPNEPYHKNENFNYKGHGSQHKTGELLGDGWEKGSVLFMQDLYRAVRSYPQLDHIKIVASSTTNGPWKPNNEIADYFRENNVDAESFLDYNNIHKYHMTFPNHRFYEFHRKNREQTPNLPFIITEMGWNSGNADHDQVNETKKADYTLRNHLLCFNAGSEYAYTFALYHTQVKNRRKGEKGIKEFGLLNKDFSPKPSFTALKNLITLVKDKVAPGERKPLDAAITVSGPKPMQTLLQKSDGSHLLILWNEAENTKTSSIVEMSFPNPKKIAAYIPAKSADVQQQGIRKHLKLNITTTPTVLQIANPDISQTAISQD